VVALQATGTEPVAGVARQVGKVTGLPPSAIVVVPVGELPRLPNGKPDLVGVAALAATTARDEPALDVRGLFEVVLGKPARAEDSFVSLGGDSLSYVEMSVRLEEHLGHLPVGWHQRTVAELEAGRRVGGRWLRTVETNVVLRALAIVAIVATHGNLVSVTGGAHLLLALVGFNLARFHLSSADRVARSRRILLSAARVAVPSVLWIGGVALLTSAYPWQTALLVNGLLGPPGWSEPAWHYWFIEALVVSLLAVALLLAVPAVDRLERRWPFWFPVALVVTGLVTRYELVTLRGGDVIHRAHVIFWLVALGWAAAKASSARHRAVVSALLVATVPGFFDDPAREAVVVLGVLALVWVPHLRVPAVLARTSGVLAASSLYVYLTHWQVYPHLEERYPAAAVAASFAVGIAVWLLAGLLGRVSVPHRGGRNGERTVAAEQDRPSAGDDRHRHPGADPVPDALLPGAQGPPGRQPHLVQHEGAVVLHPLHP
jgi:hypothetical protein